MMPVSGRPWFLRIDGPRGQRTVDAGPALAMGTAGVEQR